MAAFVTVQRFCFLIGQIEFKHLKRSIKHSFLSINTYPIGIKYWYEILTRTILLVKPLQGGRRIKGTRFTWKRELVKKLGTFSVTKIPVKLGLPELM